jgi:multidrug efflux pump subunit AcrB
MNLPRFSLTHRSIILAFIVVFLIVGTFNFATMPRREDPEFVIRDADDVLQIPSWTVSRIAFLPRSLANGPP